MDAKYCYYLVGECIDRDAERSSQTKVAQFQLSSLVDEEILGLQVSMENLILMAEGCALEQLEHEAAYGD